MVTRSFSLSLYFGEKRLVEGKGERGRAGGFEVAPWPVDDVRGYLFVIHPYPMLLPAGQTHLVHSSLVHLLVKLKCIWVSK
jgi:hypothetical protein